MTMFHTAIYALPNNYYEEIFLQDSSDSEFLENLLRNASPVFVGRVNHN